MMHASRLLAAVALAAAASAAVSTPAAAQTEVTERFSKIARLGQDGTLDLANLAGNVVITTGGGREVTIEAIKRVQRPNPNAARALLQMIDIQVVEQANRVEIRTVYPRPRNFPGSVDFTISVPEDANVTVKTLSGNVRATNIKGELRAETVSGNVVTAAARKLEAVKCISGDIEIIDAAADDLVTASTVSGNITVRGLKARAIQLGSVTGNIRVDDSQADRLDVKAVNGSIDYAGELAKNGRYQFISHSGDIRLVLSGTTGFELQANSFSGTVRSDFAVKRRAAGAEGQAPVQGPRVIRGAFGDASAMLALRATFPSPAGKVWIARTRKGTCRRRRSRSEAEQFPLRCFDRIAIV
jgi:hypothetical protein